MKWMLLLLLLPCTVFAKKNIDCVVTHSYEIKDLRGTPVPYNDGAICANFPDKEFHQLKGRPKVERGFTCSYKSHGLAQETKSLSFKNGKDKSGKFLLYFLDNFKLTTSLIDLTKDMKLKPFVAMDRIEINLKMPEDKNWNKAYVTWEMTVEGGDRPLHLGGSADDAKFFGFRSFNYSNGKTFTQLESFNNSSPGSPVQELILEHRLSLECHLAKEEYQKD